MNDTHRWQPFHCSTLAVLALAGALLAGCVSAPVPRPGPAVASPAAPAEPAAQRLSIATGQLVLQVYRDGSLQRLGHNHVVSSTALSGWVEPTDAQGSGRFRVELPVDSLAVDDPALRAAAGPEFSAAVSDADRAGTRRNMLGPALLDAAAHPLIVAEGEFASHPGGEIELPLRLWVKGVARELRVPVTITGRDGGFDIESRFVATHAQLGLVPFSVAMGAIRVREDIAVALSMRVAP